MFCLMSHTPVIRAHEIARFLREFHELGIVKTESPYLCSIKYGRKPNKNDRDLYEVVPMRGIRGMSSIRQQQCDIDVKGEKRFDEIAALLDQNPEKRIYRASLYLGGVQPDFVERVYIRSDKNELAVSMDSWHLTVGPQIIANPHSDSGDRFHLGYLAVSIGGTGYCMPRTQREVMDCVRAQPETRSVETICKSIWPAKPRSANRRAIKMRTAMGNLWPYDEIDRPVEWNWVIEESF